MFINQRVEKRHGRGTLVGFWQFEFEQVRMRGETEVDYFVETLSHQEIFQLPFKLLVARDPV